MQQINKFRQIIDLSPIPTFIINPQHKVIYWNTALENLSGVDRNSVIGTDEQWRAFYSEKRPVMADLILDGAADEVLKTYYKYKKSHVIRGAYLFDGFFPSLGRGGKWFHITVNSVKDQSNHTIAVMTTLQDITGGKNAEQKLIDSEERYKTLFESAQDAIIVHSSRGKIEIANHAASELTGFTLAELRSKHISTIFPDLKQKSINSAYPHEIHLTRKDGNRLICRVTSNIISKEKGLPLFQNIIRDVTEEKRTHDNLQYYLKQVTIAQEEERKRIARELHDDTLQTLNFLSRGVNNYLVKNPDLSDSDIEFLKKTQSDLDQAAKNMQSFIQALRLSILDDLGLIPALRHLARNLNQEGIKTEVTISGNERRLPAETESMLFRIVQESFNNIRKHSQASLAWLRINFQQSKLQITIEDNGHGFNSGERLDEMPRNGKLGLAGIEERVRLLIGSLAVNSQVNKGTSITVEVEI